VKYSKTGQLGQPWWHNIYKGIIGEIKFLEILARYESIWNWTREIILKEGHYLQHGETKAFIARDRSSEIVATKLHDSYSGHVEYGWWYCSC
jgi:hypothetical protein